MTAPRETPQQMGERHLREQQERIRKQGLLITRLKAGGRPIDQATGLLDQMNDVLALLERHSSALDKPE